MDSKIQDLKEKLIPFIIENINEQYKREFIECYSEYLKDKYSDEFYDYISLEKIIDFEKRLWDGKSESYKLSTIVKDEFMDKLAYLSEVGLKYAMKKLNTLRMNQVYESEITEEDAQKNIAMMQQYYENVKPFNRNLAQTYLSEGAIDYSYAVGLTDQMSLRVGRL